MFVLSKLCVYVIRQTETLNCIYFLQPSRCALLVKNQSLYNNSSKMVCLFGTSYAKLASTKDIIDAATKKVRVKKPEIPKVTLENTNGDILTVATIDECKRIAEGRGLRLVRIESADDSPRPTYRLMTEAQYLKEDLEAKKSSKNQKAKHQIRGDKLMMFTDRINDHDLSMKIKKINAWLSKKFEARIIISTAGADKTLLETMYKNIEEGVKGNGVIVQKRYKENDLRFQVLPPKEVSTSQSKEASTANEKSTAEQEEHDDSKK